MNRLRLASRCALSVLLSVALLAGCTQAAQDQVAQHPQTRVPSHPSTWDKQALGLPDATPACPGGEIAALRAKVPQLEAQTVETYARKHPTHLRSLRGVQARDAVYPFDYHNPEPAGGGVGMRGFFLVRGACLIHVEVTAFDN